MSELATPESPAGGLERDPEELRRWLERSGPVAKRFGQYLARCPDALPRPHRDPLLELSDRAEPLPWAGVRAVVREDLERDPDDLFPRVSPRPLVSGALALVYSARLADGARVAVKVRRPGLLRSLEDDLKRVARGVRRRARKDDLPIGFPEELEREISDAVLRETDFQRQLASLDRMHRLAAGGRRGLAPRPFPELCGSRVLTSELADGVPLADLLATGEPRQRLAELGVDADRFASSLLTSTLEQIFRLHFLNADLHPANLRVLPGGGLGFDAFGFCEATDRVVREQQTRFLSAALESDVEAVFRSLTELLVPSRHADFAGFREEFTARAKERISRGVDRPGDPSSEPSPAADLMVLALRCAHLHGLELPPRVRTIYRTLVTAEAVAMKLGSRVDLHAVGRGFFASLELEESLRWLEPEGLRRGYLNAWALTRDYPTQVHHLLSDLTDGRFVLRVQTTEDAAVRRERRRHVRLLTSSIVSVGLAVLVTWPELPEVWGIPLAWPLGGVLALLYLRIFFQWRER